MSSGAGQVKNKVEGAVLKGMLGSSTVQHNFLSCWNVLDLQAAGPVEHSECGPWERGAEFFYFN